MPKREPISDQDLAELERLDREASPAPWRANAPARAGDRKHGEDWQIANFGACDEHGTVYLTTDRIRSSEMSSGGALEDATVCAAARNALPVMIARIRELEAALLSKDRLGVGHVLAFEAGNDTERSRCAALLRGEARCERNRAASYRSKKNHPKLKADERKLMAYIAEDVARSLDEIAKKVEAGEPPPVFASGSSALARAGEANRK